MKKIKSIVTVGRKSSLCLFEDGSQAWVSNTLAKVDTTVTEADCISVGEMDVVAKRRRSAAFILKLGDPDKKVSANAMAELLEAGYEMAEITAMRDVYKA